MTDEERSESLLRAYYARRIAEAEGRARAGRTASIPGGRLPRAAAGAGRLRPSLPDRPSLRDRPSRLDRPAVTFVLAAAAMAAMLAIAAAPGGRPRWSDSPGGLIASIDSRIGMTGLPSALEVIRDSLNPPREKGASR